MKIATKSHAESPGGKAGAGPRVLFFDYWTKGLFHFTNLVAAVADDTAEFQLLHFGSWRDSSVLPRETIGGIPCLDIRAFPGMALRQILTSLKPDVVVGLNMHLLLDRALMLTCRRLEVPTVFLQHGAWADLDNLGNFSRQVDQGFTLMDRLRRAPNYLKIIPWYLRARDKSLFDLTPWRVIWNTARSPMVSHFFPAAPEELWPTVALVLNLDSAETLVKNHRMPRERVRVVGNPELDPVVARRDQPLPPAEHAELIRSVGLAPDVPTLCYIEDAFVEQQNCFGWTAATRIAHITELYEACRRANVQLLVRPHPTTDAKPIQAVFPSKPGIAVTRQLTLLDTLDISSTVLGTISTALECAFALGKPILVPIWYMDGREEFSTFLRHKVATPVYLPADLPAAIARSVRGEVSPPDGEEFVRHRLGPLDGCANARAMSIILELAQQACSHNATGNSDYRK